MAAARRSIETANDDMSVESWLPIRKREIADARKQFYLLVDGDRPIFLALNVEVGHGSAFERTDSCEARGADVLRDGETCQRVRNFVSLLQDDGEDLLTGALVE